MTAEKWSNLIEIKVHRKKCSDMLGHLSYRLTDVPLEIKAHLRCEAWWYVMFQM